MLINLKEKEMRGEVREGSMWQVLSLFKHFMSAATFLTRELQKLLTTDNIKWRTA